MNFSFEISGAVATGSIAPEAMTQLSNLFGGIREFIGGWILALLIIAAIRETVRKVIALRKAGNNKQLVRFICLFIFNTVGILPILYLIFRQKKEEK